MTGAPSPAPGPLSAALHARRPLVLDGAMGTELLRRGADTGLPLWSAGPLQSAPDVVLSIHRDFVEAGADILTTNTFRTTPRTFRRAALPDRSEELLRHAVQLAREAAATAGGRRILIAGSMAPLEDCYRPDLVPSDADLDAEHTLNAERLAEAGADFLLLETMGTKREARAAAEAAAKTGKEFVVSFLCDPFGNLYGGDTLEDAVKEVLPFNPSLVGINCVSPRTLDTALTALRRLSGLPVCVYANVGEQGQEKTGVFRQDVGPDEYAQFAAGWFREGVAVAGGCCGTTPDHIRAVALAAGRAAGPGKNARDPGRPDPSSPGRHPSSPHRHDPRDGTGHISPRDTRA